MDKRPLIFIVISAFLFGVSLPFAKLLVGNVSPVALAGLLYLGAFAGLSLFSVGRRIITTRIDKTSASLEKRDIPWLAGAILVGGVIGPISLMMGLTLVSGFSASLLLNLETLTTIVIAVVFFKENAGKRVWLASACVIAAGIFLTWDPSQGKFGTLGPLLIAFAMVCWGIDNNLTRNISGKDPILIAKIKGFVAGTISLLLAVTLGITIPLDIMIVAALLLGSFSYGISLVFFIRALEGLGSSRTGLLFSLAPFIGAITSLILLREWIGWVMFPAVGFMAAGVLLIITEKHSHLHFHKTITHIHLHYRDVHHRHRHAGAYDEPHAHEHLHLEESHIHAHWPDTHHRHDHRTSMGT
ncbi:MAG: EamA family transporter [Thermoplasmata archaeon]